MKDIKALIRFLVPFGVISLVFLTMYASVQQSIRQDANNPQFQMAEDAARALSGGVSPASVMPRGALVDISQSLAPFIMVTDYNGAVLESSATLGGNALVVPRGVFSFLDDRNEKALTLEPQNGVRIASVIVRYYDPSSAGSKSATGYVVAGRNLREAEDRIHRIGLIILLGYAGSMIGWAIRCLAGAKLIPRSDS